MKLFISIFMVLATMFTANLSYASINNEGNPHTIEIPLGSITADGDTYGFYAFKKSRIIGVKIVNAAGISVSDTDKAVVTLQNSATVIATHSTALTGGNGALTANVPATMVLSTTDANLVVPAGAYLKVAYDESGTYAMTNAKVIIHYVSY